MLRARHNEPTYRHIENPTTLHINNSALRVLSANRLPYARPFTTSLIASASGQDKSIGRRDFVQRSPTHLPRATSCSTARAWWDEILTNVICRTKREKAQKLGGSRCTDLTATNACKACIPPDKEKTGARYKKGNICPQIGILCIQSGRLIIKMCHYARHHGIVMISIIIQSTVLSEVDAASICPPPPQVRPRFSAHSLW